MTNYESVLTEVARAPSANSTDQREVQWLTENQIVGVSRDENGRIETFMVGDALETSSPHLRDLLEFQSWSRSQGGLFDANRLVFPALPHFDQVAAFVCTELLRNDADVSLPDAFARTEPIIELAMDRLRRSRQMVLGLAGELLLLEALCRNADRKHVESIVLAWNGWQRSARDISIGDTGVEVKTTSRQESSHLVEGIHQVERNDGSDSGIPERRLFLVSVGLQEAEIAGDSFTVPMLVDAILMQLEESNASEDSIDRFIWRISEYGSAFGDVYRHSSDADDPAYCVPFSTRFFRAYDMDGESVSVLRSVDVVDRQHVVSDSVKFRIELPETVGFGNPVSGANQVSELILGTGTKSPQSAREVATEP